MSVRSGSGPAIERVGGAVAGKPDSSHPVPVATGRTVAKLLMVDLLVVALAACSSVSGTSEPNPTVAVPPTAASGTTTPPSAGQTDAPMSPVTNDLWVEPNIVDRPGVPEELYDKYWVAWGQAGHVGSTALLIKPPNEGTLGGDAGRLASVVLDDESGEPLVGPNGVTVIIRDIRTGATLRTLASAIIPSYGLAVGSLLFWTGYGIPRDPIDPLDGGVWVVDLGDPMSVPRAVIPPSDLAAAYGPHADRGRLRLTDGGRTIVTIVGGDTGKATQIIDVRGVAPPMALDGESAVEVSDGRALVVRSRRYLLLDMTTGEPVGPGLENDLAYWSVVGDGEVFASFARGRDLVIAAIGLESGQTRDVLTRSDRDLRLNPELSTPDVLVLVPDDDPTYDSRGRVQIPVSLLDPATGNLQLDAFTIGQP
jgi:hypothetical protein